MARLDLKLEKIGDTWVMTCPVCGGPVYGTEHKDEAREWWSWHLRYHCNRPDNEATTVNFDGNGGNQNYRLYSKTTLGVPLVLLVTETNVRQATTADLNQALATITTDVTFFAEQLGRTRSIMEARNG